MGVEGALLASSTIMGVGGSIMQGQQQAQAAEYNAAVARQKAQAAKQAGELEASRIREAGEKLTGSQRAMYAKSGVTFSGSPMEVMIDSATENEMDALITEYNYSVQASQAESEAEIAKWRAKTYKTNSYMRAGQTLLQGASAGYSSGAFGSSVSDPTVGDIVTV